MRGGGPEAQYHAAETSLTAFIMRRTQMLENNIPQAGHVVAEWLFPSPARSHLVPCRAVRRSWASLPYGLLGNGGRLGVFVRAWDLLTRVAAANLCVQVLSAWRRPDIMEAVVL